MPPRPKYEADKKQWEEDKKKKEERLAKEKGFEGRTYIVSKYTVDWFLKDRSHFKKAAATPAATPTATPATGPRRSVPGSAVFSPDPPIVPPSSAAPPPKRIEAVTPPIPVDLAPKADPKKPGVIKEAPKPPKVAPPDPTPPLPKPAETSKPEAAKPEPAKPEAAKSEAPKSEPAQPESEPQSPPSQNQAKRPPPRTRSEFARIRAGRRILTVGGGY